MRELKIGVEIEFFGVHYETVIDELTRNGIQVVYMGYTHQVISSWKLVTDVSVTSRGTGLNKGLELVSPILYGDEGLDELKVVLDTLSSIGAKVDKSAGVHVHHDVSDYTVENFISLYNLYYMHQTGINSVLPKSRRTSADNTYCKGISSCRMEWIQSCNSISSVASNLGSRYLVLNAKSYIKYGTVEFRQHSGTVEFDKLEAWIVLTSCMVNYCKHNKVELGSSNRATLTTLLKKLNLDNSYVGSYLLARKDALAC